MKITPAEQDAAVYDREPCRRSFREDLEFHLLNGYVFNTPTLFMMGRAVNSKADESLIVNPAYQFSALHCDAWLLYLAAGKLTDFWRYEPYPLDFICFERKNVLRFYPAKRIRGRCESFFTPSFAGLLGSPIH